MTWKQGVGGEKVNNETTYEENTNVPHVGTYTMPSAGEWNHFLRGFWVACQVLSAISTVKESMQCSQDRPLTMSFRGGAKGITARA